MFITLVPDKSVIQIPTVLHLNNGHLYDSKCWFNLNCLQEWIRIKWYAKLVSQSSDDTANDVTMEDEEEDPLADDVINPAALCNVVMED